MKRYSIENIYFYSGQYDRSVTLTFEENTPAQQKYGNYLTGVFKYSQKEREYLEEVIQKDPIPFTDGYVKFTETLGKIPEDFKGELGTKGILASEIAEIIYFNKPVKNQFTLDELRELPAPIEIKFDTLGIDLEKLTLGVYNTKIENGYKLTPDEIIQYNALTYSIFQESLNKEQLALYCDPITGKVRDDITYFILDFKAKSGRLTTVEQQKYEELFQKRMDERLEILKNELERSSEKLQHIGVNYKQELDTITEISGIVEPGRLSHNKFAVWWDFERFIHIYVRHVAETQIGERYVDVKSVFQYNLEDIQNVIEIVLNNIDEEIQDHFSKNPKKEFVRNGSMAPYYNGDYYNLRIHPSGKLMTFHKKEAQ